MPITQAHRQLAVATPLGEDVLVLRSFMGSEQLGRLSQFELELLSEDSAIDFSHMVGENVTVRLELPEERVRYFNGYVSRFCQLPNQGNLAAYRATVVPWLWFLTRTADCRIFQNLTVPEIVQQIFREKGFTDFKEGLSGSYRKWDYCVQYRETDFNFVSRLLEQEGIYYFFEHEDGKHTLVLADSKSAHQAFTGYERVVFRPGEQQGIIPEYIFGWNIEQTVQPGLYSLNDFDPEKPKKALVTKATITRGHAVPDFEIYDYPGEYAEFGDGENYARIRLEELQAQHEIVRAQARARGICCGHLFALEGHPREDQNREYLITSFSCQAVSDEFGSSGSGRGGVDFSCSFVALNSEEPFRTARLTPKPVVQGPQTAMVVGPSGEEIHTDKFGRVKVQFHWDRYGQANENSSCWVRTTQSWAGKKWGALYLPRIGQEVVVEFLEGDPDRPLIVGAVYNGDGMPPYPLPDNKSISTLKSNSTKGGGGFNEIRFEDQKGEEQIFLHAEKNHDIRVKNCCFEWIGNERHLVVKKDQFEHVENNRHEIVDADHSEKIGKDRHLKVAGKEAKGVEGSLSLTVKGDVIEVFKSNHSEAVTKDFYLKAANVVIEASSNITLKVGGSHIAIEAGGIKIGTSGQLKLESSGPAEVKAKAPLKLESSAMADLKSPMTSVKGDAMVIVQGGLVKIN